MIMNFAGYSGNRELAYEMFDKCIMVQSSPYHKLAKLIRCFYETLVVNIVGARNLDLFKISQYVDPELENSNPVSLELTSDNKFTLLYFT